MKDRLYSCLNYYVYLLPIFVSGLVGVGLRRLWVRSAAAYVTVYSDDILGNGRLAWKKSLVFETLSDIILGIYEVRQP